jgi:surface protein
MSIFFKALLITISLVTLEAHAWFWDKNPGQITTIEAKSKVHLLYLIDIELNRQGLSANLNHIDVSKITNMNQLFWQSKFNGDISQWDVSKVTDMAGMFSLSRFNGDISKWDVSEVTDMTWMFLDSKFTGDVTAWTYKPDKYYRSLRHLAAPK